MKVFAHEQQEVPELAALYDAQTLDGDLEVSGKQ
jgi:hypothetical protein